MAHCRPIMIDSLWVSSAPPFRGGQALCFVAHATRAARFLSRAPLPHTTLHFVTLVWG